MKQQDWLWVLGGIGVFLLMKNAQSAATATAPANTAAVNLPAMMVSTGLFGGTMVASGLAGLRQPVASDRGRNVGTAHRARYKYPAR